MPEADFQTSADWVKILPYLNLEIPKPNAPESGEIKSAKAIYEFYKELNPLEPFKEFLKHYEKLPKVPRFNQKKLDQVMVSVGFLKMARTKKTGVYQ